MGRVYVTAVVLGGLGSRPGHGVARWVAGTHRLWTAGVPLDCYVRCGVRSNSEGRRGRPPSVDDSQFRAHARSRYIAHLPATQSPFRGTVRACISGNRVALLGAKPGLRGVEVCRPVGPTPRCGCCRLTKPPQSTSGTRAWSRVEHHQRRSRLSGMTFGGSSQGSQDGTCGWREFT